MNELKYFMVFNQHVGWYKSFNLKLADKYEADLIIDPDGICMKNRWGTCRARFDYSNRTLMCMRRGTVKKFKHSTCDEIQLSNINREFLVMSGQYHGMIEFSSMPLD